MFQSVQHEIYNKQYVLFSHCSQDDCWGENHVWMIFKLRLILPNRGRNKCLENVDSLLLMATTEWCGHQCRCVLTVWHKVCTIHLALTVKWRWSVVQELQEWTGVKICCVTHLENHLFRYGQKTQSSVSPVSCSFWHNSCVCFPSQKVVFFSHVGSNCPPRASRIKNHRAKWWRRHLKISNINIFSLQLPDSSESNPIEDISSENRQQQIVMWCNQP